MAMTDETRAGYDAVAGTYAERFLDELADKPIDRALLDLLLGLLGSAPIADIGCGPGHVARYLHDRGARSLGLDLSPRMIDIAARTHRGIDFQVADMRSLPVADQTWGGIAAFYSIIHIAPPQLPAVFAEFHRVLRPGGRALLSFHLGTELRHVEDLWGHAVSLDFQFYERAPVEAALTAAGFLVDAYLERRPYPHEVETTRAYLMARRPG
jgi:SAM-dependent methyltransferase